MRREKAAVTIAQTSLLTAQLVAAGHDVTTGSSGDPVPAASWTLRQPPLVHDTNLYHTNRNHTCHCRARSSGGNAVPQTAL